VQAKKLRHHEKQAEQHRAHRNDEVLQVLQKACPAQGNKIAKGSRQDGRESLDQTEEMGKDQGVFPRYPFRDQKSGLANEKRDISLYGRRVGHVCLVCFLLLDSRYRVSKIAGSSS
jgi:hypothetical protein